MMGLWTNERINGTTRSGSADNSGETLLAAFPGLRAQTQGGETVLVGKLPDQAALHGVLAQIEALALELLEVRRLPPSGAPDADQPIRTTTAHPA